MSKEVLVIKKRVIVGEERIVLEPDPKKPITLPDPRLKEDDIKRIVQRGCGEVMVHVEFDKTQSEKKGEQ